MSKISYGVYKVGFKEAEKMPLVVVAWQAGRVAVAPFRGCKPPPLGI